MEEKKDQNLSLNLNLNSNLYQDFADKIFDIFGDTSKLPKNFAVALSGGCDSMALTFLLQEFCQKHQINLIAVIIDHQMRLNSLAEAKAVVALLQKHQIQHKIIQINQENLPKSNIEAVLRDLRYELLYNFCCENNIKHLFLGHHIGDIAENFIIRLFRGSGLDGLSLMSESSHYKDIVLVRPLLDFYKSQFVDYLNMRNISWFEDPTNEDEKFLRNRIRNFIKFLPDYELIQTRVKKASEEITEIRDLFDELVAKNAKEMLQRRGDSYLINKDKFIKADKKIALKILALILMELGQKSYKPRFTKLNNFYNHIIESGGEPKRRNFYGCILANYDEDFIMISCEENDNVKRSHIFSKSKIQELLES